MKYLGVDFGTKKLGLANSDDDNRLAFPMMIMSNDIYKSIKDGVASTKNTNSTLYNDILEIARVYKITNIVIGESVNNDGKPNPVAKDARVFAFELEDFLSKNKLDIEIKFEKEWYSSQEARRVDGERDVDDRAAAIILQRYLDRMNGPIDHIDSDEEEEE